jgi:glycosyltransferase involved in cell wall biosynthesis
LNLLAVDHNAVLSTGRSVYRALHSADGLEVELIVPWHWEEHFGRTDFEPEDGTMKVFPSKTLFTGRSHRVLYLALARVLKRFQPDILYVNSEPEGYLGVQAIILRNRRSRNTKVVIDSWRNIDYTGGRFPYKLGRLNAVAEKYVLSHADHCIAHNRSARAIYRKKGFEAVTIIPPGIDTQLFRRTVDETLMKELDLQGFVIGYFGRFVPEKGVDVLLRAVSKLGYECRLVLGGGGPAKAEWMKLARELGLERKIRWVNPLRHPEMPRYLSALDVLVLPSYTGTYWKEQFGRILVEAMACEVSVIGSNSGEIPHVIGDAGLVFQEGDEDDLCARLSELNANTGRRLELIQRGLMRVKEHFSIPVVAQQYEKLFHRLIQS